MKLKLLEPFAARHHGLVTLDVVRDVGMSRATWLRALDDHLELVHPGVARIVGSPATREQRIAAAVLAAGRGAVASHRSAAHLWHIDLGAVFRYKIPTVKIVRILCDIGAVDPAGVHPAVGYVVTNGLVSPNSMAAAIRVHSRRGRPGVPAFREALDDWMIDGKFLDSELERRMKRLVKRFHLPPVEYHAVVLGFEVDFLIIGTPVVLECDGWEHHDKRRTEFERDRHRRAELTAAGYIVVNFTWAMLTRQPQWVASMIRGAVERWSGAIWVPTASECSL